MDITDERATTTVEASAAPTPPPDEAPPTGIGLSAYIILVAAGAFATTFAQQRIIGNLPTTFLLKEHFKLPRESVAMFFFWATFAWNLKPLAGILTDAFPLFRTRRRHYMLLGALAAAGVWILIGWGWRTYSVLFSGSVLLNCALVLASTVMGGLMVEAGQAFSAPGRISSLRQFVQNLSIIAAPFLGGILATMAFGVTAGIAAASLLALAAITAIVLRERPVSRVVELSVEDLNRPKYRPSFGVLAALAIMAGVTVWLYKEIDPNLGYSFGAQITIFLLVIFLTMMPTLNPTIVKAQGQLVQILKSRTLWIAAGMLFLVYVVPGLSTALLYRQTDVLHFTKPFIGRLGSLEGILGVVGTAVYFLTCRKVNLRLLIIGSVGVNAAVTLLYLIYTRDTAWLVHSTGGFVGAMTEIALMDLAVRSTPRGCEALGFALMMSVRNFGLAMSDVIGSMMLDKYHFKFNELVLINAGTTFVILFLIPLLPRAIINRKEGEHG